MAGGTEAETAVLTRHARTGGPPRPDPEPAHTGSRGSTTGSIGSPLEALERDEILRTRWFGAMVLGLSIATAISTFLIPGTDPLARVLMFGACVAGACSWGFLYYQTLEPTRFRQQRTALGWLFPLISANASLLYFGVFSPAPMVLVLGLYFLGLSKHGRTAIIGYVGCAGAFAALALFVINGGHDRGLIHPDLSVTQAGILAVLVEIILVTTIVTARISRRTALVAVAELEHAVRLAAHRQALLLEAREELDRAMRSKRGRFSDQTLGEYHLGDILGRGAMGEVYAAIHQRTATPVAVKLLSHASLGNANHVLRFLRELRTAAGIASPHVVRVIEVGERPVPHIVMERLEGATLSEILRERRTLPPGQVVEMIAQIGIGISAAAAAGIVHRDLKPQNVFRHHDTWKVLDFGVARAIDQGDTLTAGHVVGTPSYMAPEQADGRTVDHLTDLYALAAIAYRALTGHPPFGGRDVAETLYRVVHTRPARPSSLAPELGRDIDLALAIGMAPEPSHRFATADELTVALRDAVDGKLPGPTRARGEILVQRAGWAANKPPARRARTH